MDDIVWKVHIDMSLIGSMIWSRITWAQLHLGYRCLQFLHAFGYKELINHVCRVRLLWLQQEQMAVSLNALRVVWLNLYYWGLPISQGCRTHHHTWLSFGIWLDQSYWNDATRVMLWRIYQSSPYKHTQVWKSIRPFPATNNELFLSKAVKQVTCYSMLCNYQYLFTLIHLYIIQSMQLWLYIHAVITTFAMTVSLTHSTEKNFL